MLMLHLVNSTISGSGGARIEDSNGDPIEGLVVINYFDVDKWGPNGTNY